jgi:hypothetical protein
MALTYTYSEQHRPFPTSGNTLTVDGSPLHSRLGIDAMLSVNNLAYSMPFVGFAQAYSTVLGEAVVAANYAGAASEEWFAAQLPTVLPHDGTGRFCWTLGVSVVDISDNPGHTTRIDALNVYLSATPYLDIMSVQNVADITPSSYRIFSTAYLNGPYTKTTVTTAIDATEGAAEFYTLIDNSAGTAGTLLPFQAVTDGGLTRLNLIVTSTAHRTAGVGTGTQIYLHDFTWWIQPL